ncbi:MAG TPA: hypothetical protein PLE48_13920 [Thiobacillus sp.]|nr:hypothetical protein [Thiobacillus sp.]HQT71505.1 hypothetical protein [Thiobacillus sp.]
MAKIARTLCGKHYGMDIGFFSAAMLVFTAFRPNKKGATWQRPFYV